MGSDRKIQDRQITQDQLVVKRQYAMFLSTIFLSKIVSSCASLRLVPVVSASPGNNAAWTLVGGID
jgi:hypothetical protein